MGLPVTDSITSLLTTYLDVQSKRNELVTGNIANADTPGYKAKELQFDDFLKNAVLESTGPANKSYTGGLVQSPTVKESEGIAKLDGNTVDLDKEMTTLADTGMRHLFGIQLLRDRLQTLKMAIREGR